MTNLAYTPEAKAHAFLEHFCPKTTLDEDITSQNYETTIQASLTNNDPHPLKHPFTMPELQKALHNLRNKALGIDKIHNAMLTHLSLQNRITLLHVLNSMFLSGFVPEDWKYALVVPIPKPNKAPNRVDSCRPISLTSCLGKVMEKLINERLKWYLDQSMALTKYQAGLRKGFCAIDPSGICNQK